MENKSETFHSFQELGEAIKPSSRTINRSQSESSEPVYVRKLVAIFSDNSAEAARRLSVSPSHVTQGIRRNSIRTVTELAAKGIILEMERERSRPIFYFVEVPKAQEEVLNAFLRGIGMKAVKI